ncbi:hypothetical protein Tsubulata_030877 [Turnera subulata]|uniref:Uncharacterized protein n=1 Tax=Turnera subulata TaxID=218843 RepID=A0A9Q0J2T9_9ROSI|nr:hypothetical protein Tsubulata_030877 [Turnera subulata]
MWYLVAAELNFVMEQKCKLLECFEVGLLIMLQTRDYIHMREAGGDFGKDNCYMKVSRIIALVLVSTRLVSFQDVEFVGVELEGTKKAIEQALKEVDKDDGEFEEEEESEEEDTDGQEEVEDDDELHWAMRDEDMWDKWKKRQKGKRMLFGRPVRKKQKQQRVFLVPKKQQEESKTKKKKHLSSLRIAANVDEDEFEKWKRVVKGAEAERAKNGSSFGNTDDGFHWDVDEFDDNVVKSVEFVDLEEMGGVNRVVNCVVHVEDVKESLDDVILERFSVLIDVGPWEQSAEFEKKLMTLQKERESNLGNGRILSLLQIYLSEVLEWHADLSAQ